MGYPWDRLDKPVFMAVPKLMLTDFGIHFIDWGVVTTILVKKWALLKKVI